MAPSGMAIITVLSAVAHNEVKNSDLPTFLFSGFSSSDFISVPPRLIYWFCVAYCNDLAIRPRLQDWLLPSKWD